MAIYNAGGVPFHGEFTSSDASALSEPNSRFTLYQPYSLTTITLGSTDIVAVTDIQFWSVAAVLLQIYDGADNTVSAGEKIWQATVTVNYATAFALSTPHYCQKGTYPKVKAGAGQVDFIIRGFIYTQ